MNFCPQCGARFPPRAAPTQRNRTECPACGYVAYENAVCLASALVICQDRVLLCRRALEPARGLWCAPGGYVEKGESLREAAVRETREEAGISLDPAALDLYSIIDIPHIGHTHVLFRIALSELPALHPGPESLSAGFFAEGDPPWDCLAYGELLGERSRSIFRQIHSGHFSVHVAEVRSGCPLSLWAREYPLRAAGTLSSQPDADSYGQPDTQRP